MGVQPTEMQAAKERNPGKQHPKVLSHLHPRETDTSKTPAVGRTGSPGKIPPRAAHKANHTHPARRGGYSGVCSLTGSSVSLAAGFQQDTKQGKNYPKQEEKQSNQICL